RVPSLSIPLLTSCTRVGTVAALAGPGSATVAIAAIVRRPESARRAAVAAHCICQAEAVPFPERVETGRLVLRRFSEEDAPAWAAIWSDPLVQAALRPGEDVDPAHVEERRRHHLRH